MIFNCECRINASSGELIRLTFEAKYLKDELLSLKVEPLNLNFKAPNLKFEVYNLKFTAYTLNHKRLDLKNWFGKQN